MCTYVSVVDIQPSFFFFKEWERREGGGVPELAFAAFCLFLERQGERERER